MKNNINEKYNINKDNQTLFESYIEQHIFEKVFQILKTDKTIDINKKDEFGNTPLILIIKSFDTIYEENLLIALKVIDLILQYPNIDINARNNNDESPLACAAKIVSMPLLKMLLAHEDIKIDIFDEELSTETEEILTNFKTVFDDEDNIDYESDDEQISIHDEEQEIPYIDSEFYINSSQIEHAVIGHVFVDE